MDTASGSDVPSADSKMFEIFGAIEENFRRNNLGSDRWYLLCLAALSGGNNQELCGTLYLYLISKPEFSTPSQRQALICRLRDALIKCVSILGICKPLEAISAIKKLENEEDKSFSATKEGWQCDEANLERGMGWMEKIYTRRNADYALKTLDDHQDFAWVIKHITYGLYLSDRQVLGDIDTEIIVVAGIMIQNLPNQTLWHIRGIHRLGVSTENVQVVWDSVQQIASLLELKLDKILTVADSGLDA